MFINDIEIESKISLFIFSRANAISYDFVDIHASYPRVTRSLKKKKIFKKVSLWGEGLTTCHSHSVINLVYGM